jgi:hypothetical protein
MDSISSGTLKNIESARVSFPSQFKQLENNCYGWRTNLVDSEKYWKGINYLYYKLINILQKGGLLIFLLYFFQLKHPSFCYWQGQID